MKQFKNMPFLIMAFLFLLAGTSCVRSFEEPDIDIPPYKPNPSSKVISVREFRDMYEKIADRTDSLIQGPYVLKATVVANDISGNIFKKLYVQDYNYDNPQAAGQTGLYISVEMNNLSNNYIVGQEIYLDLDGLYAVNWDQQLQIGLRGTQANRIDPATFKAKIHRNGLAQPEKIVPRKVKISELTSDMNHSLVTIDNVVFDEGGKGVFTTDNTTMNQNFSDGTGKLLIRTSNYFSAVLNKKLPKGTGSLTGIVGTYLGKWQLILRDVNDIGEFDGKDVVEPVEKGLIFNENFGSPAKDGTKWPTVADYKGYQSADKFKYSDPYGTLATIRGVGGVGNIYFPITTAENQAGFKIEGLPANQSKLVMVYEMMGQDLDAAKNFSGFIEVKADGKTIAIPNKAIARDAWSKITIALPNNTTSVEFYSGAKNTGGLRVANVKIYTNSDLTVDPVDPVDPGTGTEDKEAFKETFGTPVKGDKGWPFFSDYKGFDMKAPVVYTDVNSSLSARVVDGVSNIWFPANKDNLMRIENINTSTLKTPVLKFKLAADTGKAGEMDLNFMKVSINGKVLTLVSTPVSAAKGDSNKYYSFEVKGEVPVAEKVTIEFNANNPAFGMRVAEIIIADK
jgi:hypothetical protein